MSAKSEIIFDLADVNITDILEQVHANMKTRGYDVEELKKLGKGVQINNAFSSGLYNEFLNGSAAAASASSHVEYWWVIPSQGGFKGKLRVFVNKVMRKLTFFYMKHVMDQQNIFNTNAAGALNQLVGTCNHLTQENNDLLMRLTSLTNENASLTSTVQKLSAGMDATMDKYVRQITAIEDLYAQRQNQLDSVNTAMAARLRTLEQQLEALNGNTGAPKALEIGSAESGEAFDYFLFESKFRGSPEEIRRRQEGYLPYFAGKQNVLDIGCGRGEFLKLLQENGISARGADLLPENIRCCQELGVDASVEDGLALLKSCEDNSLGGIFCAQVIEHLSTAQLVELLKVGREKLQAGASMILETLNPQCLTIYSESFYMDPSHTRPVHPLTVQFMAECAGFTDNQLLYLSPTPAAGLKSTAGDPQDEESLRILNNLIFGCREYALVSKK